MNRKDCSSENFPWMQKALFLAYRAVGVSTPNPAVGAVVVRDGELIGEGFTQKPGSFHAEVVALKQASSLASGADLWVTLEPCCFHGRTPPCTSAIIEAGIRRVFYAHSDPNPLVCKKSKLILENAGIEVFNVNQENIRRFYEAYDYFVTIGKTFVEVKIAETLNGWIAGKNGEPVKITSPETDQKIHCQRASSEALLIGGGTLEKDNPFLTVRHFEGNQPQRIVFSGTRKISENLNLFSSSFEELPVVYSKVPQDHLQGKAKVRLLKHFDFRENWLQMLNDLSQEGKHRLMVEPGAKLAELLFSSGLWNRLDLWTSPRSFEKGLSWNKDFFHPLDKLSLNSEDVHREFLNPMFGNPLRF